MNPALNRRRFLSSLGKASLAAAVIPAAPLLAQTAAPADAAITTDTLAAAEKLAGLAFTPEQRAAMLTEVTNRVEAYTALRAFPLSNDVFPATTFEPRLTGVVPPAAGKRRARAWRPARGRIARPATTEDLAFLPVARLAALLRAKLVTSRELTELALARLKQFDPQLACVVTLTEKRALAQADAADAELQAGRWRGPLHGVPWGAKDLLAVAGHPTTWGAAPFREQQFADDATVVKRLDAAGAVLVAKLSLGALAWGDQWWGGQTKCPWNLATGASGSSAGPAAVVAAGLVPFAIGSETLGSIVAPATRNGVTGFRPSYGRVSRAGAMALAWSMDKLGPMARSAEDCALIFPVIQGADPRDPTALNAPFFWRPPSAADLLGLRVGYAPEAFAAAPPEHQEGHGRALAALRGLGVELVPVLYPEAPLAALRTIIAVESATAFDALTRSGEIDALTPHLVHPWGQAMRSARTIPAVEFLQAQRVRTVLLRQLEDALTSARVDVWVTPAGHSPSTVLTNLTGHPAVCLPDGFIPVKDEPADSPRRAPTALVLHGRLYRDDAMLAVAHAFQQATDFHRQRPPLV